MEKYSHYETLSRNDDQEGCDEKFILLACDVLSSCSCESFKILVALLYFFYILIQLSYIVFEFFCLMSFINSNTDPTIKCLFGIFKNPLCLCDNTWLSCSSWSWSWHIGRCRHRSRLMDKRSNTVANIQSSTSSKAIWKIISSSRCKYDHTENQSNEDDEERDEFHSNYSQDEPLKRSLTDTIVRISWWRDRIIASLIVFFSIRGDDWFMIGFIPLAKLLSDDHGTPGKNFKAAWISVRRWQDGQSTAIAIPSWVKPVRKRLLSLIRDWQWGQANVVTALLRIVLSTR